jgi:tRNA threonylcarbamoyladenosine biosynthesis protein TsaB
LSRRIAAKRRSTRARTGPWLLPRAPALDDAGLAVSDPDLIVVSGGSFTGLRVGMAAALGLALGSGLPVVAVGSLEVLAYPWRFAGGVIVPVSGLRRGQIYFAVLVVGERLRIHPAARSTESFFEQCGSLQAERLLFVGDALDFLAGLIPPGLGGRACLLSSDPPRASSLARLAQDPERTAWNGTDQEGRTPRYLRDADARKPGPRSAI